MQVAHGWPPPSAAVAELIRATTGELVARVEEIFEEVDQAVLASQPGITLQDARAVDAVRVSNHANIAHWAARNLADPGARVAPLTGPETLELAREVVRRGLDDNSLEAYRVGQNVVWRRWMATAFDLASDAEVLREMLDLTSRSIFTFVDETLAGIQQAMEAERAQLVSRTPTERMEVVNLILERSPITSERASRRLRYELARSHTAVIVWSDEIGPRDPDALEAGVAAIATACGGGVPLTVAPSASTLFAWFARGSDAGPIDVESVRSSVRLAPRVRGAIGTTDAGMDGFRRTHLHALTTQSLMRRMPRPVPLAAYGELELVALASHDEEHATEFVAATLGELRGAEVDPALRETLRVWLREGRSAARTARVLFAHRNTVQNRVARAESLLAVPLAGHALEVGLALEIERWFGAA